MSIDTDVSEDLVGFNLTVVKELRSRMKQANLKQVDLSQILNLREPNISKRMKGMIPFSLRELATIAHALEISVPELVKNIPTVKPLHYPHKEESTK